MLYPDICFMDIQTYVYPMTPRLQAQMCISKKHFQKIVPSSSFKTCHQLDNELSEMNKKCYPVLLSMAELAQTLQLWHFCYVIPELDVIQSRLLN